MFQKGYQLLIFTKGYKPSGYKNPRLQCMHIKSPSAKSHWIFKLRICLSTDKVFKSLIDKLGWIVMMILNDWGFHYIIQILNSQHGWIFIMVINNQYYDWGFQSRFSAMPIILSMYMLYSTMEGTVLSRCRLTTRHLGATLSRLRLHQIRKSHVTASMYHGTWGLMQDHF